MYFKYNQDGFPENQLDQMHSEFFEAGRRLTFIFDPHIKKTGEKNSYHVYANGMEQQMHEHPRGEVSNIFVRESSES